MSTTYWLITADDSEPFGNHPTLHAARVQVRQLKLSQMGYSILSCTAVDDREERWVRVEHCEPRHFDARARQGMGQE